MWLLDKLEKLKNSDAIAIRYMDEFISACFLPHTNIEQFPTVKAILGE